MSKLLPDKLNEKFKKYSELYWEIHIHLDLPQLTSYLIFELDDSMILFFSHVPLVRLDSAEDLQAFLTGIKGKMMNEQGEVSVSDLTDTMTESDFVKLICEITGCDPYRLKTDRKFRGKNYPLARQLHIVVRKQALKMTLSKAGEIYLKDHATALYSIRTITGRRRVDNSFRRLTDPIFTEIDAIISGSRRTM